MPELINEMSKEGNVFTMLFTPAMETTLIPILKEYADIELELIRGARESMKDGRVRIIIEAEGEKAEVLTKIIYRLGFGDTNPDFN